MLKFLAKFVLFFTITLIIWFFVHSYYETILWFFTVKVSQIFSPIPYTNPDIIDGKFVCRLENATLRFIPLSITVGIFITIPLLLATSGISLFNKIKITILGLCISFLFQSIFLLIVLSSEVYQNYHLFLQKGVRIDQIITYTPAKALIISWLYHFFNNVFQYVVSIGIWVGLVSYYKRSAKQGWIQKLF